MGKTILRQNDRYVERIFVEYDAGESFSLIIKLTKEKEAAYKFEKNELKKISGLIALDQEEIQNEKNL